MFSFHLEMPRVSNHAGSFFFFPLTHQIKFNKCIHFENRFLLVTCLRQNPKSLIFYDPAVEIA